MRISKDIAKKIHKLVTLSMLGTGMYRGILRYDLAREIRVYVGKKLEKKKKRSRQNE